MKRPRDNDEWISRILNSIEGAERATPPPFLLTRIEAELDSRQGLQSNRLRRPKQVLAFGMSFAVLVLVNVLAIEYASGALWGSRPEQHPVMQRSSSTTSTGLSAYSELTGSSFHLYE